MKVSLYLKVFIALFLSSCSAPFVISKTSRVGYPVNESVAADSAIIRTYMPYKQALDAEMNMQIGVSAVDLTKASSLPESVLGNFFADAVLNQAKKIVPRIDFVFPTTKGGLRNDIWRGPITVSKVFELMPFENQLVLLELKGEDVLTILKDIANAGGQPVALLKMNINKQTAENIFINGKAFDVKSNYFVLTSDYIANGGDDSKGFSKPISRRNIGLMVRDALLQEVKDTNAAGKSINSKLDGRITKS